MSIDDVIEVTPGPLAGAGRRRRLAVGLVVAALAVTGGVVAWTASRGGGSGGAGAGSEPLTCPATIPNPDRQTLDLQPPVPALPTASGVDGRLVPTRAPSAIVLCAYQPPVYGSTGVSRGTATGGGIAGVESPSTLPTSPAPDDATDLPLPAAPVATTIALTSSATTTGDADAAAPLVTALQGATVWGPNEEGSCAAIGYPQSVQYLLGLTYDDGIVWVATQDGCPGSTNGVARGGPSVTADVSAALAALPTVPVSPGDVTVAPEPGTVEPAPSGTVAPGDPGVGTEPGASGSASPVPPGTPTADPFAECRGDDAGFSPAADAPLVPFTPTAVVVCHAPINAANTVDKATADVAKPLAAAIDALPTIAPDTACPAIGGETWQLLFLDDTGDQVSVAVDADGCGTVGNGVRSVQADDDFFARMRALG